MRFKFRSCSSNVRLCRAYTISGMVLGCYHTHILDLRTVLTEANLKSAQRRRKHCALTIVRGSQKFSPRRRPLPGDAGWPKFNQLEMHHYLYLQTQFGEDRCTQFRVMVVTDPLTHTYTHPPTHRQDRLQYTAPQLARSVIIITEHASFGLVLDCRRCH